MNNMKQSSKTKITRKNISNGGNINNQIGLDKILSIGYEVECSNLVKLTETQESENTLYNSDSVRQDMEEIQKIKDNEINGDNDDLEESIDADIYERFEEKPTVKMYRFENKEEPGTEYPDAVFNITNDIANPNFNRTLNALCKVLEKDNPLPTDIKDTLYKYRCSGSEKEYDIHFKFKETTRQLCSTFSEVEWIVTYYKPPQSNNIIIDTFLNMIKNIVYHIDSFEPIPGQIIYKSPQAELETVVPGKYMLYKSALEENTALYYLQTDQVNPDESNSIDNVCSKTQMTFSAKAEDIIDVMLKITADYTGFSHDIPEVASSLTNRLTTIQKIQQCVDKLYDYLTISNILTKDEKIKLRNKKIQIKQLKTYMFLILFKINRFYYFMFYNDLVKIGKRKNFKYLKDLLLFNSRHTNYVLYTEIKEKIKELLEIPVEATGQSDTKVIQIIKELFLQPEILSEYLIEEEFKTEEYKDIIDTNTIFSKVIVVDKENDVYGDPSFSLKSYFDFFEDPIVNEKNTDIDGTINYYDWLVYADYDISSTNMDLKDDIVLLECRFFQDLLTGYFYHIGNETLKEQMTKGACNKMLGKIGNPNTKGFSIANFKEIIKIPETSYQGGSLHKKHRTRKNKKIRTKKHKKTKRNKNKNKPSKTYKTKNNKK